MAHEQPETAEKPNGHGGEGRCAETGGVACEHREDDEVAQPEEEVVLSTSGTRKPRPSVAIRDHTWPYVAISGHPWPSVAMHGHTWPSELYLSTNIIKREPGHLLDASLLSRGVELVDGLDG